MKKRYTITESQLKAIVTAETKELIREGKIKAKTSRRKK